MWFIGVEVEQETSAPPPKKNPGSAPVSYHSLLTTPNKSLRTSFNWFKNMFGEIQISQAKARLGLTLSVLSVLSVLA